MSLISLKNFDRAQEVLKYSTDLGVQAVRPRKPDDRLDRGFFTQHEGRYYGVFATVSGPIAFLDSLQWPLTKSGASSEFIQLPGGQRRFILCVDGAPAYEVTYQPSATVVDNWSDDESISEFFSWLHESVTGDPKGSFFSFYRLRA